MYDTKLFRFRLETAMARSNYTQAELVKRASAYVHMTRADVSKYIKGEYYPTMEKLCAMATVLDVETDWLCGKL